MSNPLVIPAGYGQATFAYYLTGRAKAFSFSLGVQLATNEQDAADALGGWFDNQVSPGFAHQLASNYNTDHVEVVGHSGFGVSTGQVTGVDTTPNVSPGQAARIVKRTALRGKANKGAMFWAGVLREGDVHPDGSLDPAALTFIATAVAGLSTAMSSAGLTPVILHRSNSSTTTPTPIQIFQIAPLVRSQRRRQIPR